MDSIEGSAMLAICWMLCIGDPEYGRPVMERAGLDTEATTALTDLMESYAEMFSEADTPS